MRKAFENLVESWRMYRLLLHVQKAGKIVKKMDNLRLMYIFIDVIDITLAVSEEIKARHEFDRHYDGR